LNRPQVTAANTANSNVVGGNGRPRNVFITKSLFDRIRDASREPDSCDLLDRDKKIIAHILNSATPGPT